MMTKKQNKTTRIFLLTVFAALITIILPAGAGAIGKRDNTGLFIKKDTWQQTMLASRRVREKNEALQKELFKHIEKDFPIQCDWLYQDYGLDSHRWFGNDADTEFERKIIIKVLAELAPDAKDMVAEYERLCRSNVSPTDQQWLDLYVRACERRREICLHEALQYGRLTLCVHRGPVRCTA
jgi:hypothetical protein